jgi:putative endonuclease
MPKTFTSVRQKIGEMGERVAVSYYQREGYQIVEQNYTRPVGEIDIIAQKAGKLYFIEVKSKRMSFKQGIEPGENMHKSKRAKLRRVIGEYLKGLDTFTEWQCDLAIVVLNMKTRLAKVSLVQNCIV